MKKAITLFCLTTSSFLMSSNSPTKSEGEELIAAYFALRTRSGTNYLRLIQEGRSSATPSRNNNDTPTAHSTPCSPIQLPLKQKTNLSNQKKAYLALRKQTQ